MCRPSLFAFGDRHRGAWAHGRGGGVSVWGNGNGRTRKHPEGYSDDGGGMSSNGNPCTHTNGGDRIRTP